MAEGDAALAVESNAFAVRPAMMQRRKHRLDCRKVTGVRAFVEKNSGDAAHLIGSMLASAAPCQFPWPASKPRCVEKTSSLTATWRGLSLRRTPGRVRL